MKWLKRGTLVFFILCGVLLLHPLTAQAKKLKESKSYSIDLDGDGKKEMVRYEVKTNGNYWDEEYGGCTLSIYIDGKKAASVSDKSALSIGVSVIDVKSSDKYQELYVHFTGMDNIFVKGCGYRFQNKTLKNLFTFSTKDVGSIRLYVLEKQPGDGMVHFRSEFYDRYVHQGFVKDAYKIKSGRLKQIKKSVMRTSNDWRKKKYKATMSLKAYGSIGARSAAFAISKGDVFYIYKLKFKKAGKPESGITYFYVRTASGKTGWVKNPQKSFYQSYSEYDKSWKDYPYVWG